MKNNLDKKFDIETGTTKDLLSPLSTCYTVNHSSQLYIPRYRVKIYTNLFTFLIQVSIPLDMQQTTLPNFTSST
jgi:hypothetical protein